MSQDTFPVLLAYTSIRKYSVREYDTYFDLKEELLINMHGNR